MKTKNVETVKSILEEEYNQGYIDGLREGYRKAQSIFIHFSCNHKLVEPEDLETLTRWGNEALESLMKRIRDTTELLEKKKS